MRGPFSSCIGVPVVHGSGAGLLIITIAPIGVGCVFTSLAFPRQALNFGACRSPQKIKLKTCGKSMEEKEAKENNEHTATTEQFSPPRSFRV